MNKYVRIFIVLISALGVVCIGKCFYMVACISCTPDPVKTYNYPGSMDQLENNFKEFTAKHRDIYYKSSHRGPGSTDAIDIAIKLKMSNDDILCDLVIYDFNGSTKLDIQDIFDSTNKTGGNNEDDVNVKKLLTDFEDTFLIQFKKDQNIEFKRRFFNF